MTDLPEADIQAGFLLRIGARPGLRLFRNTVGEGWQGEILKRTKDTVTLLHPRYVTFGLCPDSSDLIGWKDGRFLAVEIKKRTGRVSNGQRNFLDAVIADGGIADVVRDADEGAMWIECL